MNNQRYEILVVEDDPDDRDILLDVFTQLGCAAQMTLYPSGTALLNDTEKLRTLTPFPHVIALDYQMPCSTGLEVLKILKRDLVLCTVAVILYSTSISRIIEKDCLNKGLSGALPRELVFTK